MKFCLLFCFLILANANKAFAHGDCHVALSAIKNNGYGKLYVEQKIEVTNDTIEGPDGGKLYLVKKTRADIPWNSYYEHHQAAVQGNVQWIEQFFGKDVAVVLGYREISDREYRIPNADQVNGAISKINKILVANGHEEISISFFGSKSDRVRVREYLEKFKDGLTPISEGSPSMVHDTAYHVASIAMPKNVVDLAKRHTEYLLDFIQKNEAYLSDKQKHHLMMIRMAQIDEGSANSFHNLIGETADVDGFKTSIKKLAYNGNSPMHLLRDMKNAFYFSWGLKRKIDQYIAEHQNDPNFNGPSINIDAACEAYIKKVKTIREAAESMRWAPPQ